jgi:hypothetical protein
MKSNLTEKLSSICGSADKIYGCNDIESITRLTEEQRIQVEAELINHFGFDRIVWMDLPAGLTEDGAKAIVAKTIKISDSDNPTYKHKVGYVYTINFTPKMYDPMEMYQPVKDGCVFSPIVYNPETFEPTRSITLTWSPEFAQDFPFPTNEEVMKQSFRDRLEKVLANPEEYRPSGFIGCLIRYAVV